MCGIAGIFQYNHRAEVSRETLASMAQSIEHRGPDDEEFYVEPRGKLGLAFRRLSIIDLDGGKQPMASGDGRYRIVFNGEIYNYMEVRSAMEARGRTFRTRCDTEAIVEAYAEYGPSCVDHLQGMFALAIWDEGDRTLFVARDRIGIKPLYYSLSGGSFVFGSEIKALFRHPDLAPRLNREELARYFTFLSVPPPNTLFEGIQKLRAGHTLLIREGREPSSPRRYWSPVENDHPPASEGDLVAELRELLTDAVKCRLMSDVPFGAFLSGGVDSSAIVAIMAKALDRPVRTFNVGYKDDPAFNETVNARKTSELYGTEHHEIAIDHEDFRSFLPRLVHHQDEPIADPVCVPLYFVAELARKNGVIVTLVGEGSDELFFGYDIYNRTWKMVEQFWNPLSRAPHPLRSLATRAAEPFVDKQRRDYLRRLRDGEEPFIGGSVAFFPEELKSLAPSLAGDRRRTEIVETLYREIDQARPGGDFPLRTTYLELMYRLPELLLMRVDKMTMATSVEGRVPFLDHRLVELAFRIPSKMKVRGGVRKYILKEAVSGLVPDEIIHRKKVGFHVPVTRWFEEVLGPMADDVLLGPEMRDLEIWDPEEVRKLLELQRSGKGNYGMRIWSLVNFALWYRHWFRGESL